MQVISVRTSASKEVTSHLAASPCVEALTPSDWELMYKRRPNRNMTLFELEALVAKRMEFLAWIDQLSNSPKAESYDTILDTIGTRIPKERSSFTGGYARGTVLGYEGDEGAAGYTPDRRSSSVRSAAARSGSLGNNRAHDSNAVVVFDKDEDLVSHLLCRYAFCMSERWRKWLVKTEEMLLCARLKLSISKNPLHFIVNLMEENNLPCNPLSEEQINDSVFQDYLEYRYSKSHAQKETELKKEYYYSVPLELATRLIRNRSVLCRSGKAILFRDQVQEVFLTIFRGELNRGLHEAYIARMKQQKLDDQESEKLTVMHMLDTFLEQFIANPLDTLQEGTTESVKAGDVQRLALTHFPLCMRQIDLHLRREGHLKHHGRFMYGLFLKAIGLSMEDSLTLFATLMTQKGEGSVEAFSNTSYGYNVRHNYGMEGKKTSYSSASCATIMDLPPIVDKQDCHGCPFRFRDEAAFRLMLQRDQNNPAGKDYPPVRPSAADIEDIISDCKGQHYTRACYKYFVSTHKEAKRDMLFRSPYEYFCCSRDSEVAAAAKKGNEDIETPIKSSIGLTKRVETSPVLKEDVIRTRV
ncbi:unnamed protein product [Phytomonas sp. EM1]|nr:unnamed protein product [Phytomonas sp. EM1]|eukprot:CCW64027.1 unnamed protein product [Phytomonas sp. isolate EM1]